MMGGALAIGRDFFWELGGFDEGMTFWGGEQFEMSLKIWMCGGQLLEVPCSRVGHLFRDITTKGNSLLYGSYEFCNRNYRRILDVWIEEESRNNFLEQRPSLKRIDAGNLEERQAIAQRLQCKSFSWMLENIMPEVKEILSRSGIIVLASGLLRSVREPTICLTLGKDGKATQELCPTQSDQITQLQSWRYTKLGEIRSFDSTCLESDMNSLEVKSFDCHFSYGNQKWYYDRKTQWLMKPEEKLCVFANVEEKRIQLKPCEATNKQFKWTFSHMNQTEMDQWEEKLRV